MASGSIITRALSVGPEPLQRVRLGSRDVRRLLKRSPGVIPFIEQPEKCFVLENVAVEDDKVDLLVVEPGPRRASPDLYLVYLRWYRYGSRFEAYSADEAYWEIGHDIEAASDSVAAVGEMGSSREQWALELKRRIKERLGVKRLSVGEVYMIAVFDELPASIIGMMDYVNDVVGAYVDAMQIQLFRGRGGCEMAVSSIYTWR
ncbi:MAG: hypothetical protein GXO09_03805 [Crenarchaeota archaeon]|nr:hypothetical protein [Thermoproteota archaeon]